MALTAEEIRDLIHRYESDLRKLNYQTEQINDQILHLSKNLKAQNAQESKDAKAAATPAEAPTEKSSKGKGSKKKSKKSSPVEEAAAQAPEEVKAAEPAAEADEAPKKRRGRPRKEETSEAVEVAENVSEDVAEAATEAVTEAPKKRGGRPRKVVAETEAATEEAAETPKKKGGRPRKVAVEAEAETQEAPKSRKPRAKKEEEAGEAEPKKITRERALSAWDEVVMEALNNRSKAMNSGDLLAEMMDYNEVGNHGQTEDQLRNKLNASLTKLGKKGLVSKADYEGKGHAYALATWYNKKGELLKKYSI